VRLLRPPLAAVALLAGGCLTAESATMFPGVDCTQCHKPGTFPHWTAAGTIYLDRAAAADQGEPGVVVHLTDSLGKTLALTTNEVGNFYTAEPLEFPIHVEVERLGQRLPMPIPTPRGGCNGCHNQPPQNGAPGRIYAP
jgi:hypothetical protein